MRRVTRAQSNATRATCIACHRRKVKCNAHDVGFPCSRCQNSSSEEGCIIYQKRKRVSKLKHLKPSDDSSSTSSILLPAPRPPPSPAVSRSCHPTSPASVRNTSQDERPLHRPPTTYSPETGRRELPHPTTGSVASPADLPFHTTEDGEFKSYLVEFIDQPRIIERPIDKDARIAYVGTGVSNVNFLLRQQFGARTDGVSHYPTNRIARRRTCQEPGGLPVEALQLPSKSVVNQLLHAYFTYVHPGFPVVDKNLFMKQYQARDPQNPPSLLLLHCILVAGAHVLYGHEERAAFKSLYFRRAKTLFDARFERDRDTAVQAALLLAWHTDGIEDVLANAWFWVGVAVRTAMGLGMHRDADNSTLVQHNKHMWRRVWWILVQCDVMLAMQYGRPLIIDLRESDVKPLSIADFQDCGPDVRAEHCIQAAELCVILGEGVRGLFGVSTRGEDRQRVLRKTDEALANWLIRLPRSLNPHSASALDCWGWALQIQYHSALILFHRQQAISTSASQPLAPGDDADICTRSAVAIQQSFQHLCDVDGLRVLWISSVNCLFTALIQLNVEVRIQNPVLAISAFQRYESALVSLRKLAEYWPNALSILHFFENSMQLGHTPQATGDQEQHQLPPLPATPSQDCAGPGGTLSECLSREMLSSSQECPPPAFSRLTNSQDRQSGRTDESMAAQLLTNRSDATREVLESWENWQKINWQQPDITDDFLFMF
ncbi:hypothetical protein GQ53DRAFT_715233 [Thozetella sp. PMI_491]|nr:hypothetical protein GQ53DRAFT_715233 [Thozetella sp. PMI_491]